MIKIDRPDLTAISHRHFHKVMNSVPNSQGVGKRLDQMLVGAKGQRKQFLIHLRMLVGNSPLGSLITMRPEKLHKVVSALNRLFPRQMADTSFKKQLYKQVFFYDKYKRWGAYERAKELKVNVCPYCNRQYTFTIDTANGKTRPQFDHFWDKDTYPMLALCFFNLVPSCSTCNASFKHTKAFSFNTHIHPYHEGFGNNIRFKIQATSIDFINGAASDYKIRLQPPMTLKPAALRKKAIQNIKVFCLEELYNEHKDYVDEIIVRARVYNKAYINGLLQSFQGTLFNDEEDVKRTLMANYLQVGDHDKRVLAKLTADIAHDIRAFER